MEITTRTLPRGFVGDPYQTVLEVEPRQKELTWRVDPAMPAGLQLDTTTGAISGTPTESDFGTLTFFVTNARSESAHASLLLVISNKGDDMPTGTVIAYAGKLSDERRKALHSQGWLVCDGRAISREEFEILFDTIGITYGTGDGVHTFNLPDYRGRFLRGVDDGARRDPDAAARAAQTNTDGGPGNVTGDEVGTVQGDMLAAHSHRYNSFPGKRGGIASGDYWANETRDSEPTGGNETRPKNSNVNYLIRYDE